MLILLVSVKWQLLPASGYVPLSEDFGQSIRTMLMPAFVLGTALAATLMRHTRSSMLSADYVRTARAKRLTERVVVLKHALPNALPPILVQATLIIATAIIAKAALSFLGLGQQPPEPSWGSMLNTAKNFLNQALWMALWPGVSIFLVVLGFNLLGDGLRDALDPREH